MTTEDLARQIMADWEIASGVILVPRTFNLMSDAIAAALRAEREACAQVVEKLIAENFQKPLSFSMIAKAIRSQP